MKQSEAVRIPELLAARQPRPVVEEANIEGTRMLVILGNEVDTVIRYNRNGAADMPQLASYPEVAESAAQADERLAKQRASGRTNTTGEGADWPRNWKLAAAKAVGKIWYVGCPEGRAKSECNNVAFKAQKRLPPALLSVEELLKAHAEYKSTVPNNYVVTMERIEKTLTKQNAGETAGAVAEWLKNLNRQFYRFNPDKAVNLREELEPLIAADLTTLLGFRSRSIATLTRAADEPTVHRLFNRFRPKLGPVGTGKALHVLAPNFFPLWDNAIASDYGVSTDDGYFQFMILVKQQVVSLPDELATGLTALKAIDEYNYLQLQASRMASYGAFQFPVPTQSSRCLACPKGIWAEAPTGIRHNEVATLPRVCSRAIGVTGEPMESAVDCGTYHTGEHEQCLVHPRSHLQRRTSSSPRMPCLRRASLSRGAVDRERRVTTQLD